MDFNPNKTPIECNSIEIIKEGDVAGTCFRDVYSNINKKMVQRFIERIYSFKKY